MIRHFLNNHPKLKTFAMKRNDVPLLINCFRVVTAPLRPAPFFILIGAHKSASTTLYDMICSHPEITQAYEKEPCYFQCNHKYGQHWYRSRFPICRRSGEASTGYHWFPETPGLVARELPNVKLIAIFRNPVERAYSHYQHWKREGLETLEFVDAIACERAQPMDAWDWCLSNPSKLLPVTIRAYLSHGCYARQLAAWYRWFDPEQILICRTEGRPTTLHGCASTCGMVPLVRSGTNFDLSDRRLGRRSAIGDGAHLEIPKFGSMPNRTD